MSKRSRSFLRPPAYVFRPELKALLEDGLRKTVPLLRALPLLLLASCGTAGHATLQVSAPATVAANAPFSVTVTAMYNGQRDTVINGPIHFTTTDPAAQLPTLYVFTAADAGQHTFTDLTLVTPGNQTVTVSDYDATPVAGSTNIVVTSPADGASQ